MYGATADCPQTLSTGDVGQAAWTAGLLFETTGDIRFLDQAVRFSDNMLAVRNNPVTGRIMWDGQRDLVWPTKPQESLGAGYAGSESADTIGHMVCASATRSG